MSTIPATIVIPGIAAYLERFLRPAAATAGDGIEIRQDRLGTTVSVREGRHAATISTATPGDLEPILVDPAALAGVDPSQPAKLYRMAETVGVVAHADGELVSIAIRNGTTTQSARDLADTVEGEVASGMTRAVFEVDPRHLLAVAEALVATGAEKATVAIAPRWNVLACSAETAEVLATFMIAGESFSAPDPETTGVDGVDDVDPLTFTIGERKSRSPAPRRRRKGVDLSGIPDGEIPW